MDFILHVDVHLVELFNQYGLWIYAILFCIIFAKPVWWRHGFTRGFSVVRRGGMMAASGLNVA